MRTEVKLQLTKDDDDQYWLEFASSKGPSSICLNAISGLGGIINRSIIAWADEAMSASQAEKLIADMANFKTQVEQFTAELERFNAEVQSLKNQKEKGND
jgi:hypothetical protein